MRVFSLALNPENGLKMFISRFGLLDTYVKRVVTASPNPLQHNQSPLESRDSERPR